MKASLLIIVIYLHCFCVSGYKILNLDSGQLQNNSVIAKELAEYLQFFAHSIGSDFSGANDEGRWGTAFEELSQSNFFKYNIIFLRKAVKELRLSGLPLDQDEKKAFFLNLYNVLLLDALLSLEELPVSIGVPTKFERKCAYQFKDFTLSLGAIKHGILRANRPDPYDGHVYLNETLQQSLSLDADKRILAALYLTSASGAPFRAYSPDNLEKDLDLALSTLCENGVMVEDSNLLLSEIFEDYMEDFGPSEQDVLIWLAKCAQRMNKRVLLYFASKQKGYLSYSYISPSYNLTTWAPDHRDKLDVDIYTESHCNDSKVFFLKQLVTVWPSLKNLMKLNIITFGKASVTPINNGEDFIFECQNGPDECQGNKVMSCSVALLPEAVHVPFIACLHDSTSTTDYKMCASKVGVPFVAIRECFSTMQGARLLYENGEKTFELQPRIFFVPTIAINNAYNSKEINRSINNFGEHFCDVYRTVFSKSNGIATPSGCKTKVDLYLESMNPSVQKFFTNQLIPTWNRLQTAIDLNIIPFGNSTWTPGATEALRCPRGPLECYGNIVISCIVNLLSKEDQIRLLGCMFSRKVPPVKGRECAKQEGISWTPIGDCADGADGPKLLKKNEVLTTSLVPPLSSVPTVAINGIHNETFKDWAVQDLMALICDTYYMVRRDEAKAILPTGCPVRVELYIETLCPDTQNFFIKYFYPAWKKLKPIMDVHMVPFGKANVWRVPDSNDYEFECQNGPLECRGNKMMSCAIKYLPIDLQVEFITCMLRDKSPSAAGEKCAKEFSISWDRLDNCSTSVEASHLLFKNGIRTMALKPTLFFVPTVTINGYYDKSQLQRSLKRFEDQICETYLGSLSRDKMILTPKGCRTQLEVFLDVKSEHSRNFVTSKLLPTWSRYKRLLDLEFHAMDTTQDRVPLIQLGGEMFSQRKASQCSLDKSLNCVASIFDDDTVIESLQCIYKESGNPTCLRLQKCSEVLGMPWEKIFNCAQGTKGDDLSMDTKRILQTFPQDKSQEKAFSSLNKYAVKDSATKENLALEDLVCTSFYNPSTSLSTTWRPGGCSVKVDVYLASLCPDSRRFFLREVEPAWRRLKGIMNLRIIPFGKASASIDPVTKKYEFECQHGPAECHGNRILSCMSKYFSIDQQVDTISCMYGVQISTSQGQKCTEQLGLDWNVISTCMKEESSALLMENGKRTNKLRPSLFFVPTVTINEFYSKSHLRSTLKDLSGSICKVYLNTDDGYSGPIPPGCKVQVSVYFSHLDEDMKDFFAFHAEEFWKYFKDIADLRFFPLPQDGTLQISKTSNCSAKEDHNSSCHSYQSKFLSCLTSLHSVDIQMEIMACLMSQDELSISYDQCAKEFILNDTNMKDCINSQKSQEILEDNLSSYNKVKHLFSKMPLIIIEKVIIREYSKLTSLVCKNFQGVKPSKCQTK